MVDQLPAEIYGLIASHLVEVDTKCGRQRNATSFANQAGIINLMQVSEVRSPRVFTQGFDYEC